jgi:starch-binding outer membrane protein, SusD/RagB family
MNFRCRCSSFIKLNVSEISVGRLHTSSCKLLLFFGFLFITSCKKFIETDTPRTALVSSVVFANDESAIAAMVGIYSSIMQNPSSFINTQITLVAGLSADEFNNFSTSPDQRQFFENSLTPNNSNVLILWREAYKYIYEVNAVLNGVTNSKSLSATTKNQIEGEAKFVRALCFFYLTNLFGDIPLTLTTDYRVNNTATRSSQSHVYDQIVSDLKDAQKLLSENYVSDERVRPNKWAATAVLARVYLYIKDWTNAVNTATEVINQSSLYFLNNDLASVFSINSPEIIWQLMPVVPGYNTWEGNALILSAVPTSVSLSNDLIHAFEVDDMRKSDWISEITIGSQTYHFAYKYKIKAGAPLSEYYVVLRLGEQYLIRAEAKAQLNDLANSLTDLNLIRARAGISNFQTEDKSLLLTAVENERRIELFAEMGHRWLDIKRNNTAGKILSIEKNSNWQATDVLYPIPQAELSIDYNLEQNPGY